MAFSPDGLVLAAGTSGGGKDLILWDVGSGDPIGPVPRRSDQGTIVAFSPDGRLVASGSPDGSITLWDVGTHQPVADLISAHFRSVERLDFSPGGNTLFSVSEYMVIRWDLRIGAWKGLACQIAGRNLTEDEWKLFIGDDQYQRTCPDAG